MISDRLLGEWPTIAAQVELLRQQVQAGRSRGAQALDLPEPTTDSQLGVAKQLYTRLIAPWVAQVGAGRSVVLIPDDDLAFAPFAALIGPDGRYLVETIYFSLLDSSRELARLHGKSVVNEGALIVGGPDFDSEANRELRPARTGAPARVQAPAVASRLGQVRGALTAAHWAPLPGAAAEAKALGALFGAQSRTAGLQPKLLLGATASEASWKALAPGRRYLHLATHGYFARQPTGAQRAAAERNPLLLSGLLFAGANRPLPAQERAEDGWLAAEEVAGLDLQGTELVVLSACETGLGGAGSGEGVFGLRRAFLQAGVRGLVLSLWQVDDEATVEFMHKFWSRLLACTPTSGCAKAKVLADTQREMLATGRWRAPQYWAAFVYAGEWSR